MSVTQYIESLKDKKFMRLSKYFEDITCSEDNENAKNKQNKENREKIE